MTGRLPAAYRPGTTALDALNPLVKAAWLVSLSVLVFAVPHPLATAGGFIVEVLGSGAASIPAGESPGIRMLTKLAVLLFAVQALFVHSGQVAFYLLPFGDGALPVIDEVLWLGFFVAGRLLAIFLFSYLFVLTTEPNELAHALMRAGLLYRYGFALIVALRLLPVVEMEANTVYQAHLARGIRYDRGGPRRFFLIARQPLFPLLASALGRVDVLAFLVEGRCFGRSRRRTYMRESRFERGDWIALGGLAALLVGGVALSQIGSAQPAGRRGRPARRRGGRAARLAATPRHRARVPPRQLSRIGPRAVQLDTLPYNALVMLTGDVTKSGFVTVNDVFPYRNAEQEGMSLRKFILAYGATAEYSRVVPASTDGCLVSLDRDNISDESLLLPYLEGIRFSDENQHVSTWLKGISEIVVGSERKIAIDSKAYMMGQSLAKPTMVGVWSPRGSPRVALFFLDGFGYLSYLGARERGDAPNLSALPEPRAATTVYPSVTAAASATLLTGLRAERHEATDSRIRSTWSPTIVDAADRRRPMRRGRRGPGVRFEHAFDQSDGSTRRLAGSSRLCYRTRSS